MFDVLLNLLLVELQRVDIRAQLAEALVEMDTCWSSPVCSWPRAAGRCRAKDQNYGKSEKLLVFHASSLETPRNRCKSRIVVAQSILPHTAGASLNRAFHSPEPPFMGTVDVQHTEELMVGRPELTYGCIRNSNRFGHPAFHQSRRLVCPRVPRKAGGPGRQPRLPG